MSSEVTFAGTDPSSHETQTLSWPKLIDEDLVKTPRVTELVPKSTKETQEVQQLISGW